MFGICKKFRFRRLDCHEKEQKQESIRLTVYTSLFNLISQVYFSYPTAQLPIYRPEPHLAASLRTWWGEQASVICPQFLEMLKVRGQTMEEEEKHIVLSMDCMHLTPAMSYEKHQYELKGLVDCGTDNSGTKGSQTWALKRQAGWWGSPFSFANTLNQPGLYGARPFSILWAEWVQFPPSVGCLRVQKVPLKDAGKKLLAEFLADVSPEIVEQLLCSQGHNSTLYFLNAYRVVCIFDVVKTVNADLKSEKREQSS